MECSRQLIRSIVMNIKNFLYEIYKSMVKSFKIIFYIFLFVVVSKLISIFGGVPEKDQITIMVVTIVLLYCVAQLDTIKIFWKQSERKLIWIIIAITPLPVIIYFFTTNIVLVVIVVLVSFTMTIHQSRYTIWQKEYLKLCMIGGSGIRL